MIHRGIINLANYEQRLSESSNQLLIIGVNGYTILKNHISVNHCNSLERDLMSSTYKRQPFRCSNKAYMSGITRSPFILSRSFRDLLLDDLMSSICNLYFPSGYQLHLSRAVTNEPSRQAFTKQLHRDIPFLHTPSTYPLSLSFLTFISDYDGPQLSILPETHGRLFYNYNINSHVDMCFSQGDTIVFDSNLLHYTPETTDSVSYVLHMFTSPILKRLVRYTSSAFDELVSADPYRLDEVFSILGFSYDEPADDNEYLLSH